MSDPYRWGSGHPPYYRPPDQTHQMPYEQHPPHCPPPHCPPPHLSYPPQHAVCPPSMPMPPCAPTAPPCHGQVVQWVPTSAHAPFPPYAVRGGVDRDGTDIFVGRAFHEGDLIPAKVIPAKQIAYVAYDGREIMKHSFEVMCTSMYDQGRVTWRASHGSSIPYGAIPGGHTAHGETLYIGRVFHDGAQTVGKVHPSHGKCYIPYDGHEHHHHSYEVLVQI